MSRCIKSEGTIGSVPTQSMAVVSAGRLAPELYESDIALLVPMVVRVVVWHRLGPHIYPTLWLFTTVVTAPCDWPSCHFTAVILAWRLLKAPFLSRNYVPSFITTQPPHLHPLSDVRCCPRNGSVWGSLRKVAQTSRHLYLDRGPQVLLIRMLGKPDDLVRLDLAATVTPWTGL